MEVDEIQRQAFKFQRISGSNGHDANNIGHPDEEEDRVVVKRSSGGGGVGNGMDILGGGVGVARLCGWPSSRIVRVSRASGGKDRHSKVLTSKGLRDRRVRLSVTTAIQFYDLQDRLGYDQPSKAVEWLIKAASSSIAELPGLNPAFPDTPKQLSNEKSDVELDGDPDFRQIVKSACSSTSETSKGSGLSLSRSESRIKARERARERAAEKEKEKENDSHCPISQNSSFTELLTAGINNNHNNNNNSPIGSSHRNSGGGESDLVNKSRRQPQWINPMEFPFTPSSSRGGETSFLGHMNSFPQFTSAGDHNNHHPEPQHFSFVQENFVPVATTAGESYNLNFSMSSSGLAGFNRGTLQSNSSPSSLLSSHLQRFDGSNINLPFFNGSTASASNAAAASAENHHQFPAGFNPGLQLCYGETPPSGRHSNNHKGKGKH